MKDFILYLQPRDRPSVVDRKKYPLDELRTTPGTSPLRADLEIVKSGELKPKEELGDFRIFDFSCKYIARHGTTSAVVSRDIELWQSKKGALVVSFGFPRKVSNVATKLLSLAAFGDHTLINQCFLTGTNFLELKKRAQKLGGTITLLDVKGVSWGGGKLKHLLIKGRELEMIPGFDDVLTNATRISSIGFAIPDIGGSTRHISFRVLDWGGGQIYSPADPLPHELSALFDLLEKVFFETEPGDSSL